MTQASKSSLIVAYMGACLAWGSTWMVIKVGLRGAPPLTSIGVRMALASAIVYAIVRARRIPFRLDARFVRVGVLLGFFHIVFPYSLVYFGELYVSSGLAAVLFATMPLFVALLARATLGDPLTANKILGIVAGLAGVGIIFSRSLELGATHAVGTALVMGSMLTAAIGSVATKRWNQGYHPVASLLIPFTVGALVTGGLGAVVERVNPLSFGGTTWFTIVYLAVVGSVIAFALFFYAMQHLDVTVVSYQTFIIPVIAVLLGRLFLDERMSARTAVGALVIFAGVSLATVLTPRTERGGGAETTRVP